MDWDNFCLLSRHFDSIMAEKDNANPVVHQAPAANQRTGPVVEWWRDPIHSSAGTKSAATFNFANTDSDDEYESLELPGGIDEASSDQTIDSQEVYDLIRSITDPEHPLTLEQLAVVNAAHITVDHGDLSKNKLPHILLEFTPTIPHCSMATLIGLSLRVRLLRSLPDRFKVDIRVRPGTHQSENAVNKQLNDKERVAAALENEHLFNVVQSCLASAARRGSAEDSAASLKDASGQSIWKTIDEIASRMGIQV